MDKLNQTASTICLWIGLLWCGDTFSIVAVNPLTQEVGSAGASCIGGSIIISDLHPGVGAVHTQSWWNGQNQNLAENLMDLGYSPQEILDSLVENDAQNDPSLRQYGAVDLIDGGRSAAFTGENCMDYKNHITGPTYAIQGNILLGQEILDGMENNYLNTEGTFAERLMASLQGANVAGADTRCLSYGTSSLSAFIRIARQDNSENDLFLHLNVDNLPNGVEPIDALQNLFDDWNSAQPTASTGDVNSDGLVNIADILLLVGYIIGTQNLDENQIYAVDMNSDSTINIQDIIIIVNIVIN